LFVQVLIAVYLDLIVVNQRPPPSFAVTNLIVWGTSLIFMVLPFISSQYGVAGQWCWIGLDPHHPPGKLNTGIIWRLVYYGFELGLAAIIIIVCYFRVTRTLQRFLALDSSNDKIINLIRQLRWYPLVYILTWIPTLIVRGVLQDTIRSHHNDKLRISEVVLRNSFLQGIGNFAAYGANKVARAELLELVCSWYRSGMQKLMNFGFGSKKTNEESENPIERDSVFKFSDIGRFSATEIPSIFSHTSESMPRMMVEMSDGKQRANELKVDTKEGSNL
jgi:hypothetical protein